MATERLPAVLYHGTDVIALWDILVEDRLRAGLGDGGTAGVSFSSRLDVARGFADDRQEQSERDCIPEDYGVLPAGRCRGAVVALDAAAMTAAGVVPSRHVWEGCAGADDEEEAEWRVPGELSGLSRFLVAIHVRRQDLDWHAELLSATPARAAAFASAMERAFERTGSVAEGDLEGEEAAPRAP